MRPRTDPCAGTQHWADGPVGFGAMDSPRQLTLNLFMLLCISESEQSPVFRQAENQRAFRGE